MSSEQLPRLKKIRVREIERARETMPAIYYSNSFFYRPESVKTREQAIVQRLKEIEAVIRRNNLYYHLDIPYVMICDLREELERGE